MDGDEHIRDVPMKILEYLPEFGVKEFHVDYRRNSGLLWVRKEDNPEFMKSDGMPNLQFAHA